MQVGTSLISTDVIAKIFFFVLFFFCLRQCPGRVLTLGTKNPPRGSLRYFSIEWQLDPESQVH